jgi:hypothetical protein
MAAAAQEKEKLQQVTIAEARKLARRRGVLIVWRPDPRLEEPEQYCLTAVR